MASTIASADWYPDPSGRYTFRYWDGSGWTDHVAAESGQALDAVGDTVLPPPPPVNPAPVAPSSPAEALGPPPGPAAPPPPPPPRTRPRARLLLAAGVGVLVVAAVVIAVLALRGGRSGTTKSSGSAAAAQRPFRMPDRIADFALGPGTSNPLPNVSELGTYNRATPPAAFVVAVIRMTDAAAADTGVRKGVADLERRWNSSTAETVRNAGTSYTCVTGTATNGTGSPAVGCYWRVGDALLSMEGVRLDQQTLLNLAFQAQPLVVPAG